MEDEFVTKEEMLLIRSARGEIDLAASEYKNAQLNAENISLKIFMRYGLKAGVDHLKEDGKIVRGIDKASTQETLVPPPPPPPPEHPADK